MQRNERQRDDKHYQSAACSILLCVNETGERKRWPLIHTCMPLLQAAPVRAAAEAAAPAFIEIVNPYSVEDVLVHVFDGMAQVMHCPSSASVCQRRTCRSAFLWPHRCICSQRDSCPAESMPAAAQSKLSRLADQVSHIDSLVD